METNHKLLINNLQNDTFNIKMIILYYCVNYIILHYLIWLYFLLQI